MNLDEFLRYIIWIIVFGVALGGIYVMLTKLGVKIAI